MLYPILTITSLTQTHHRNYYDRNLMLKLKMFTPCYSLFSSEPPRVSLSVGPTLLLEDGSEQKIVCDAESYYPLDVEIVWYVQDPAAVGKRVGAPLPKVLQNMLLSSHRHNQDKTYTVSGFFYLQASLKDSGRQFTCSVSHKSLRVPIKKSFVLTVEGEDTKSH